MRNYAFSIFVVIYFVSQKEKHVSNNLFYIETLYEKSLVFQN